MPRMHLPGAPASGGIWSIERVVALLTPFFSAGAGWVTSIIANNIPGVSIPSGWVAGLFATGTTAAAVAALKWLHGRQKFVNFTTDSENVVHEVVARLQALGGTPLVNIEQAVAGQLKGHEAAIIDGVISKIGLPPSADDLAKKIVAELWPDRTQAAGGQAASGAALAS
jgi:hypothetical protein